MRGLLVIVDGPDGVMAYGPTSPRLANKLASAASDYLNELGVTEAHVVGTAEHASVKDLFEVLRSTEEAVEESVAASQRPGKDREPELRPPGKEGEIIGLTWEVAKEFYRIASTVGVDPDTFLKAVLNLHPECSRADWQADVGF